MQRLNGSTLGWMPSGLDRRIESTNNKEMAGKICNTFFYFVIDEHGDIVCIIFFKANQPGHTERKDGNAASANACIKCIVPI